MRTRLYVGENLFRYGFENHPLSIKRYTRFLELLENDAALKSSVEFFDINGLCDEKILRLFHISEYIERVRELSEKGYGYIDYGDTPVFKGIFEVSLASVCASVDGLVFAYNHHSIAVNLAGGWHHAYRDRGSGFCVFNDIGVSIEVLRSKYGNDLKFYYIDIDAHHGDGVYYSYESDPNVYIFDIHEDGRFLFPGTGSWMERGSGEAFGTKTNVPLPPWSGDEQLLPYIDKLVEDVINVSPDVIIFQAGQDGLSGDPLTHLQYSDEGYLKAVERVFRVAKDLNIGVLYLGGGGYQPEKVAENWIKVLRIAVSL